MSWFDEFTTKMNLSGKSLSEEVVKNTQYILDESFTDSPTFKLVKHKGINIPTRIVSVSAKNGWSKYNDNYRKVIFQNRNYVCNIGDTIEFDNTNWLAIDKDNVLGNSVIIERCNNELTFLNTFNALVKVPCIISNLTLYSDGLDEGNYMTLQDGKRSIVISKTNDTSKLEVGHRFIFNHDENSIFAISHIDDFSVLGLIVLTMTQEQKQSEDDFVNNLADNNILPITITFPQIQYTINQGNTLQLQPTIKQGYKILILSTNWKIESFDNQGFASVDKNGKVTGISVGEGKVVCTLEGNENIKCEVGIKVISSNVVPSVSYLISGDELIRKTITSTYVASKFSNNVEDTSASFQFFLDYNGLPTSAVTMSVVNNHTIKIKNNSADSGSVILRVMDMTNGANIYKTIQFKGIYG